MYRENENFLSTERTSVERCDPPSEHELQFLLGKDCFQFDIFVNFRSRDDKVKTNYIFLQIWSFSPKKRFKLTCVNIVIIFNSLVGLVKSGYGSGMSELLTDHASTQANIVDYSDRGMCYYT